MRYMACILVASAGLLVCPGCGQTSLCDYAPMGTSAKVQMPSLSLYLLPYFVMGREDSAKSAQDLLPFYSYNVVMHHSFTPGFRCLCALLNGYFGEWQRLVIVERVDVESDETGFVVVALTRNGLMGVTNLRPVGPGVYSWEVSRCPRSFQLDRPRFQSCLAELDEARQKLKDGLFLFENIDWPLYLLHDIRSDGSYLAFGTCGWAEFDDGDRKHLLEAPPDYAKAAALVGKAKPWQAIANGSPPAKELREAGATYAALIARVWESTLGRPDYFLLGRQQE